MSGGGFETKIKEQYPTADAHGRATMLWSSREPERHACAVSLAKSNQGEQEVEENKAEDGQETKGRGERRKPLPQSTRPAMKSALSTRMLCGCTDVKNNEPG